MKKLNVIVTGATGMVGEGVLFECMENPQVENILIIVRKPSGVSHPKVKEIIHKDFSNIEPIKEQVKNYDACFFCLGVSSIGMKEDEYTKLTYTLTLGFAKTLSEVSPQATFCYVSGAGTDSTEKGKSMWARVKGKTENDLAKLPFKATYNFRPGMMKPSKGQQHVLSAYKYMGWLYPIIKGLFANSACTIQEVGRAMINVTLSGYTKQAIEVSDILTLAKKQV
ncbi:MAG: epimerase [Bacteroidota bacterium]